jgi:PrcB C-terminal
MRETLVVVVVAVAAAVIGLLTFVFINNSTAPVAETEDAPVVFRELAQGDHSSVERRVNYLVYSEAQMEQLWELIGAVDAAPEVDFTAFTVIGIFSGKQPTAGYEIAVDRIVDTEARNVTITTSRPGASCFPAKTMTEPYQVIVVPKTSLSYALEYVPTTIGCLR